MTRNPEEFVNELKELFAWKKPFLLDYKQRDSVFDTIKAYLQKKNLIVISKVEYDNLQRETAIVLTDNEFKIFTQNDK